MTERKEENDGVGIVAVLFITVVIILLQVQLAFTRSKLSKAKADAKLLENKINDEKRDRAVQKTQEAANVITQRIQDREQKLEALYKKIGVLDTRTRDYQRRIDDAKSRRNA